MSLLPRKRRESLLYVMGATEAVTVVVFQQSEVLPQKLQLHI